MTDTFLGIEGVTFIDEVAEYFSYCSRDKRIEIGFEALYHNNEYVENHCRLIVEDWEKAYSQLHGEESTSDLEVHLGIASMILSLEKKDSVIEMTLHTLDDRYVNLFFFGAEARVVQGAGSGTTA